jgi:hypothetical protein
VTDGQVWLGGVCLELGAVGRGIVSWRLRGVDRVASIDGLATEIEDPWRRTPAGMRGGLHPNRAVAIDHLVILTPDFERTARELTAVGMPLRRIRQTAENVRQGFRRLGPAILELVEAPYLPNGPARFWGLVVIVSDLDALAGRLGKRLGSVKPAVQPGRQITTLRSSAGLGEAVAFMTPEPR